MSDRPPIGIFYVLVFCIVLCAVAIIFTIEEEVKAHDLIGQRSTDVGKHIPPAFSVREYFAGRQPVARAFWLFWVLGTLIFSFLYYQIEFGVDPEPQTWGPLLRWMGFSQLYSYVGLFVVARCEMKTRFPTATLIAAAVNGITSMFVLPFVVPRIPYLF